jgi:hypothetical protein
MTDVTVPEPRTETDTRRSSPKLQTGHNTVTSEVPVRAKALRHFAKPEGWEFLEMY